MSPADLPERPEAPIAIGASSCLTGAEVRYDGSGARSSYPHHKLKKLLELRPICPEVGIGMSTPRPPIRLVGLEDGVHAVGVKDASIDVTRDLEAFAEKQTAALRQTGIAGYVFMKNSPSCGVHRVKLYAPDSEMPTRSGRGIYAAKVMELWPELPVEDCGRLFDDVLCENFVARVFTYAHWLRVIEVGMTPARLVAFHSRYKYLLMAHDVSAYKSCGQLLANLKEAWETKPQAYIVALMQGLSKPASRGNHTNVLSHLQGYFKTVLSSAERQELATLIQAYRRGEQPLLAVLAVLRHHLSRYPDAYVACQTYLEPTPAEAGLRRTL